MPRPNVDMHDRMRVAEAAKVLPFPMRERDNEWRRAEVAARELNNIAPPIPMYRCAGGCGVFVTATPALCLSCATQDGTA